jgi:uncharacterized protein
MPRGNPGSARRRTCKPQRQIGFAMGQAKIPGIRKEFQVQLRMALNQSGGCGNEDVVNNYWNRSDPHGSRYRAVRAGDRRLKRIDLSFDPLGMTSYALTRIRKLQRAICEALIKSSTDRFLYRAQTSSNGGIVHPQKARCLYQRSPTAQSENISQVIPIHWPRFCGLSLQFYAFPTRARNRTMCCSTKRITGFHLQQLRGCDMLYAVLFEDNSNLKADIRAQHMAAHLSFLEKNAAQIKAAGPLRASSPDPAGGLWLVEAESSDAVDALVKKDPFWPTGLRRSVRILHWSQVFRDGKRLL